MAGNIISYVDMCRSEGASLQQGMNFALHSVILMSQRRNAPYKDQLEDDGTTLIYEGHDQPKTIDRPNPKAFDQLEHLPSGKLTQTESFIKQRKLRHLESAHRKG